MRDSLGATANGNGRHRALLSENSMLQMVPAGVRSTSRNMPIGYRRRTVVQCGQRQVVEIMEREMGLEPTTFSLGNRSAFESKRLTRFCVIRFVPPRSSSFNTLPIVIALTSYRRINI